MKKTFTTVRAREGFFVFYFSNNAGACTYGLVFLSLCANF